MACYLIVIDCKTTFLREIQDDSYGSGKWKLRCKGTFNCSGTWDRKKNLNYAGNLNRKENVYYAGDWDGMEYYTGIWAGREDLDHGDTTENRRNDAITAVEMWHW